MSLNIAYSHNTDTPEMFPYSHVLGSFSIVDLEHTLYQFIHPIHRFKSSDWLKEGLMTWSIFDNLHVWKLIHVCQFSQSLEEAVTAAEFGTRQPSFQILRFGTDEKSMNGVYKTDIDCSFIRGMVENYCTLGKIQHLPTIHRGTCRQRLNFTSGTITIHRSSHEQSNKCKVPSLFAISDCVLFSIFIAFYFFINLCILFLNIYLILFYFIYFIYFLKSRLHKKQSGPIDSVKEVGTSGFTKMCPQPIYLLPYTKKYYCT